MQRKVDLKLIPIQEFFSAVQSYTWKYGPHSEMNGKLFINYFPGHFTKCFVGI